MISVIRNEYPRHPRRPSTNVRTKRPRVDVTSHKPKLRVLVSQKVKDAKTIFDTENSPMKLRLSPNYSMNSLISDVSCLGGVQE